MTAAIAIPSAVRQSLDRDGYVIVPSAIDSASIQGLIESIERAGRSSAVREKNSRVYAMRNLMALVPEVADLAQSASLRALVEPAAGKRARAVRALLFDKTPGANWKVAWHQDLSIAVRERHDVPGFGPWSLKAGVPHVQPPVEILERMVTVRLHLDDCFADNGPLQVLAGSHRQGAMTPAVIQAWRDRMIPSLCESPAGGAVLMRPLILHASATATSPFHRRVIHIEFSADELPAPLEWCSA